MVLSIDIPPLTEARLLQQAEAAGQDVRTFVSLLVEKAVAKCDLDELLAPLRQQFAASGVSDEELVQDITDTQTAYRSEKSKQPAR